MFTRFGMLVVLVAAVALSTSLASADYMMPGAIGNDGSNGFNGAITATTSSDDSENSRGPQNAVNGAGMDATGSLYSTYGYAQVWQTVPGTVAGQWLMANLGGSYALDHAMIWNSNVSAADRGLYQFDLYVSNAGTPGTTFTDPAWTKVNTSGLLTLNYMCGQTTDTTPQTVSLAGIQGQWVALVADSNYGNSYPVVGISEIQFWGTAAQTPEPSSMVLLGSAILGLLAYAWRKRK